ncbi:MAG TPA: zinc-dependent alcohol dehydrogenase family protein [Gemmatimonadaceae bacterium]|jgi:NADPH2:quinone reductase
MRALRFSDVGDPMQVLHLDDVPSPEPGPGDVRVRMTHRPINPADLLTILGYYPIRPSLPGSPGLEGVGLIDAVGANVKGVSVGQRVISVAGTPGTWAEQLVMPADRAVPIPDAMSNQVAAQTLVNPVTAWALLNDELTLSPNDWVLQTAAGSTLGRLIVQLARRRGLRTINVVRRRSRARELLDLGADAVVVTEDEALVDRVREITGGRGVPAAIDAVGGTEAGEIAASLAPGGTMITMGGLSGATLGPIGIGDLVFKGASIRGFWLARWTTTRPSATIARALGEVISMFTTHELQLPVAAEYDLADFRAALRHAEQPGRTGKVLLRG